MTTSVVDPTTETVRAADVNPLLEGAILLALDELINEHTATAVNILMAARVSIVLYNRALAAKQVEKLSLVSRAIEGEWP